MAYAFELDVYGPETVLATMLVGPGGGMKTRTAVCITRWVADAITRKATNRFLYLTCDAQFDAQCGSSHEWSCVVIEPVIEGHAVVSGLCGACAEAPNLLDRLMTAIRAVLPDARVAPLGHA